MDCLKLPQVADMIPCVQAEKKIENKKMKKSIMILIMVTAGFFCSGQSSRSTPDSVYIGTFYSTKNVQSQKPLTKHNENNFNTKYEYTESPAAVGVAKLKAFINYQCPCCVYRACRSITNRRRAVIENCICCFVNV